MNTTDFITAVAEMRALQRQYFATRDGEVLRRCKSAESKVDRGLEVLRPVPKGPSLFDMIDMADYGGES